MSKVIGATIAALVLVVAMVAPTLAHTATVTCEHITLGNVPVGVSASLTPGPITITAPNPTTSINGTYEVPPATYLITFSDGFVIPDKIVPSCASQSPPPSASPSTPPSSAPSSAPSTPPSSAPSAGASSSPSAAPSSSGTPGASSSGAGGVLGATATPRARAPSTDALADSNSDGLGASLPLLVFFLVGINIGLILILRTPSRPHRRGRQG